MVFSWLWKRRHRHGDRKALHVVLYARKGCHLCDTAWEQLQQRQREFGFDLEAVDVDDNPDLGARYGIEVPVVSVNGKVRFRGQVNTVLLDRLLRAEARRDVRQS
jgi:hypothetical protein